MIAHSLGHELTTAMLLCFGVSCCVYAVRGVCAVVCVAHSFLSSLVSIYIVFIFAANCYYTQI